MISNQQWTVVVYGSFTLHGVSNDSPEWSNVWWFTLRTFLVILGINFFPSRLMSHRHAGNYIEKNQLYGTEVASTVRRISLLKILF
jgi:hypothetical protein